MKSNRKEIAHLMRRAGFGATAVELDELTSKFTYDEIVDSLVKSEGYPDIDQSYVDRYYFGETSQRNTPFISRLGLPYAKWETPSSGKNDSVSSPYISCWLG